MLLNNIKRLTKDSAIYGLSGALGKVVALILLPILTRVFSPADYGVIDVITTFSSIISIFLLLGLNSSTQRYYFDATNDVEKHKVVSTAFWFLLIFSSLSATILYSISGQLALVFFGHTDYISLLKLTIIVLPLTVIISFGKDNLRLLFAPWRYNIVTVSYTLLRVLVVIYLVVILRRGLIGNFEGALIASIISTLLAIYFSRSLLKFTFSFSKLKQLLRYGVPLAFAGLAYWIISLSDRLILLKLSTLDQIGLYSVGNRISEVLLLIISAFSLAWAPFIFEMHKKDNAKKMIVKSLTYLVAFLLFISLILSLFAPEFLLVITTNDYIDAANVVGILSIGLVFLGISGILATGLTIVKKTKYITISSFVAAGVNIGLNFLLIPSFGMIGAAFATLLAYLSLCLVYYYYSQKYFKLQFEIIKIFKIFIIISLFIVLGSFIVNENIFVAILLKFLIIIVCIISLLISRVFSKDEIAYVLKILRKIKSFILSKFFNH